MTSRPPARNRLENIGVVSVRRKPTTPPKTLTAHHLRMIAMMVHGAPPDHEGVRELTRTYETTIEGERVRVDRSLEPGVPLSLTEAATVCRVRLRNARELSGYDVFRRAYQAEMQKFRESESARSLATMVEVRDDPGAGKAADRKVRLAAAQALIGEGDGKRQGTTVNVYNGGQQITAGLVVIDPRKRSAEPPVIEHEDPKSV